MLTNTNGTIIKIDSAKSFLDIREAFIFSGEVVEKILFQFRSYDKNKPKGQKITQQVDFYMTLEDASYFADIMKTGKIRDLCNAVNVKAAASGKGVSYAFGYQKFGGTASKKISKQLKVQVSEDGRLWIKALEGPGIVEDKGQIKPAYKDNEATNKVAMILDNEQMAKIGLAIERAIRIFDTWSAMGIVKENVAKFHKAKQESFDDLDAEDASIEDRF